MIAAALAITPDGKVKGKKEESDGEKKRREEERQSRAKKLKQVCMQMQCIPIRLAYIVQPLCL